MIRSLEPHALSPQFGSNCKRIYLALLPPPPLIAGCVIFAVMNGAERNSEFVAYFQGKSSRLGIANMMCLGRDATADDTWLLGDKAKVFL